MELTKQQEEALALINEFKSGQRLFSNVFHLHGYAGTGKTTIAKSLYTGSFEQKLEDHHREPTVIHCVQYGAFTGKAASVMRLKGCVGAQTLHSLCYKPVEDPKTGKVTFVYNDLSPLRFVDLIVIDEVSMVGMDLGRDVMSFNKPVIVIGDPAQLPPVKSDAYFTTDEPDYLLTQIHRQAEGNPIIHASMNIRNGKPIEASGDDLRILRKFKLTDDELVAADQILTGKNDTRMALNHHMRKIRGYTEVVVPGDKLVCLRNNRQLGCYNGTTWTVLDAISYIAMDKQGTVKMWSLTLQSDDDPTIIDVVVPEPFFQMLESDVEKIHSPYFLSEHERFTYGYALTVHKSQGSQWDNVLLFDESFCFRNNAQKWLYTGVTRAAKKLTVVR